jgi:hypothetical protein
MPPLRGWARVGPAHPRQGLQAPRGVQRCVLGWLQMRKVATPCSTLWLCSGRRQQPAQRSSAAGCHVSHVVMSVSMQQRRASPHVLISDQWHPQQICPRRPDRFNRHISLGPKPPLHSSFPPRTPRLTSAESELDRPAAVRSEWLRPSGSVDEPQDSAVHASASPSRTLQLTSAVHSAAVGWCESGGTADLAPFQRSRL